MAAKRLLDRLGLDRLRLVRWLAGVAKLWACSDVPGTARSVCVKTNGFALHVPERFLPHYVHHDYEPLTARWMRGFVTAGMRAADVGAHIGYFSLLLARLVGETGRIYAVEPAEENLRFLKQNVSANKLANVTVLPVAAGQERRRRRFNITGSSDSHGFYRHPLTGTCETLEVLEAPLDELIAGPLHLVKIDVEGAELEVLKGMNRILEENPRMRVAVEWNPACMRSAGYEPEELPLFLKGQGFELSVIDEKAGRARTLDEIIDALREGALEPAWYGNLVGARGGRP